MPRTSDGDTLPVTILERDGVVVLRPLAELTADRGREWRNHLARLATGFRAVIDLDGTPFMDSAGLGVLIGGIRRIRQGGGEIVVVCAQPAMRRLLRVSGVDRIVEVTDDRDEAHGLLRAR